jgi:hypothetical protein
MARKLISIRGGISISLAFLAAATLLWIASTRTIGSTAAKDEPQWDAKASKELHAMLHRTHELSNVGDLKALKQSYMGDDTLVTFELDPDNATPVSLRSKKEIDAHLERVSTGLNQQGSLVLDLQKLKMNCKATASFGVCTEECTIRLKKPDGTEQVDHFFGTGTAVKSGGEWKWVQWHMSVGGARENVKSDGKVGAAGHGGHHE